MKKSCFIVCDTYVSIQMVNLEVTFTCLCYTRNTLFKFSLEGQHLMFCKCCFIVICGKQCQFLPFVVF